MMGRMVLVGMVAALGISIPTWPEIEGWMKSLHSWTAGRLAAWDASHGSRRVFDLYDDVIPRTPTIRTTPSFDPIVPDDNAWGIALELNRNAEGIDQPVEVTVARRSVSAKEARPVSTQTTPRPEFDRTPAMDDLEGSVLAELLAMAKVQCTNDFRRPPACTFSASRVIEPIVAEEPREPAWTPIDPDANRGPDIGLELNRFGEGMAGAPGKPLLRVVHAPRFEPIDVASSTVTSVADELNRMSEGIGLVPDSERAQQHPSAARRPDRVVHALKLTRRAWLAWAEVMTGPESVRVSAR